MNRYTDKYGDKIFHFIIEAIIGLMIGVLIVFSNPTAISIAISVALLIILFFLNGPIKYLSCILIVSPFAGSTYLKENYFDIPGAKPLEVLALILIISILINYKNSSKIPKYLLYYSLAIIVIFTVCIARSLQYLNVFNDLYFFKDKLSFDRYLLSHYFKPFISFIPLIIIPMFTKKKKDLLFINNVIIVALILLSIQVICLYVNALINNISSELITDYYWEYFGFHRNNIATFYLVGLPIAFSNYYLNKNMYNLIFIIIILAGIGLNFSRSSYLTSILAIIFYIIISKRAKFVPIVLVTLILISLLFFPNVVKDRATVGLNSKDMDSISAGRIENIWVPLIKENIGEKASVIFGKGRYAIQSSKAVMSGSILRVAHPHNMYLEIIIDAGIIGFIVFIMFYYNIVRNAFYSLHKITDPVLKEYLYAYIVSIICFLVSGFTDRSFFPTYDNIFIYTILGCTIVLHTWTSNIYLYQRQVVE